MDYPFKRLNNTIRFKRVIFIALFLYASTVNAELKPQADVIHQERPHKLFQTVLTQHVSNGVVDYPAIQNSENYHTYISKLENRAQFKDSAEELSYWINAYNALAIKGILNGRSPESFFGKIGYFYNAEYKVSGLTINLYDLEHDIIIPMGEPRIHFALNCASTSCPLLNNEVYQADKLEQQLEQAASRFINDKTRNQFNLQKKVAYLSKIFDWFENDFSNHSGSVQNYLALYISDKHISNTLANNEFEIKYLQYDWSLNGTPPKF